MRGALGGGRRSHGGAGRRGSVDSLAVEAGDPEASAAEEKIGDRGAEGEDRDLRVREGRELGEEIGVAGDGVVAELGVVEADPLVETLGGGGGNPEASAAEEKKAEEKEGRGMERRWVRLRKSRGD